MENESKQTLLTYSLILVTGLIIFSSFFEFRLGEFDWPFLIIAICYITFSTITEIFVTNSITSANKKVIASRVSVNKSLQKIDENNKWDEYKKELVQSQTISYFYKAYLLYFFEDKCFAYKRNDAKLSPHDFKYKFLNKELITALKGEKLSLFKKRKIRRLVMTQDDSSYVDKVYAKYKKGGYLGKSSFQILKELVSILIKLGGFVASILTAIHFDASSVLTFKLIFFLILLVGDIYFIYKDIKFNINYEIELAESYEYVCDILVNGKESDNKKRIAYYIFNSIK